ncbi:MAG: glycine cleavage system protein GcvH [Aeropyrum sp.]|nr:glycine cleavage system protein GcvH [Aeropyrum sp.]MCE4616270.1 glycine cleavage system protein GcvH [Aeropyrum sp.]
MASDLLEVEVAGIKFKLDKSLKYTESDEWVRVEGGVATVGITDFAQKELKDIVGVELPEVGAAVKAGDTVATVESIKATAEIYSPVSGEIVEVNEKLLDAPETINEDPYGEGWIFKVRISDPSELDKLLDFQSYIESVKKRKS